MLIEFSVGNYRSFKEVITFSMVAAPITSSVSDLDSNNVFKVDDNLSLLKSAAIYGANASGKSNLINAISFMRKFVLNSVREREESIDVDTFKLSTETDHQPAFFEIIFQVDKKRFRYSFELDSTRVVSERLSDCLMCEEPNFFDTDKEVSYFTRGDDKISISKFFEEGKDLERKTRKNALFLSTVSEFNGQISQSIRNWFKDHLSVISGLTELTSRRITISELSGGKNKESIEAFIRKLDLGFSKLHVVEDETETDISTFDQLKLVSKQLKLSFPSRWLMTREIETIHSKFNASGDIIESEIFNMDAEESEGTRKIFSLAGPIILALAEGKTMIIDEFDSKLHPLITCTIVQLFNSVESNPKNAQLILTTHDINLLSSKNFRRDQIWFIEKDRQAASKLYSLVEYKIEEGRNEFERDYIKGRYGAIPFIGDFSKLPGISDAK